MGFFVFDAIGRVVHRRRRQERLRVAEGWPVVTAKLLTPTLVMKDSLAEGTSDVQDSQVECPYYFTLGEGFYGGHVRSVPCTDSEGRRIQRLTVEGTPVEVRYNPANPDEGCVLATDNVGTLPFVVWPG